jgi:hypothetical protein
MFKAGAKAAAWGRPILTAAHFTTFFRILLNKNEFPLLFCL